MLGWLQRRIRELREGLEELQAQETSEAAAEGRRPGPRRQAPVHISSSEEAPWELPKEAHLEALDLGLDSPIANPIALPPTATGASGPAGLRRRLREPGRLRDALVLREILDPPVSLRRPVRRSFRDR